MPARPRTHPCGPEWGSNPGQAHPPPQYCMLQDPLHVERGQEGEGGRRQDQQQVVARTCGAQRAVGCMSCLLLRCVGRSTGCSLQRKCMHTLLRGVDKAQSSAGGNSAKQPHPKHHPACPQARACLTAPAVHLCLWRPPVCLSAICRSRSSPPQSDGPWAPLLMMLSAVRPSSALCGGRRGGGWWNVGGQAHCLRACQGRTWRCCGNGVNGVAPECATTVSAHT